MATDARINNTTVGIAFMLAGGVCISINDMLIKYLSGDYPLHQMVFIRSAIAITFSMVFLQFEGGLAALKSKQLHLHFLRSLLIAITNLTFFAGLAILPLAQTTTLFFVAPLFITLLSIPFLGEKVGLHRLSAVLVGFLGVIVMMTQGEPSTGATYSRWVLLLPVLSALTYSAAQILTRRLGVRSTASAMAIYIQVTLICVSLCFFLVAGDGRFVAGQDNPVVVFLLREWVWPSSADWPFLILLGFVSSVVAYALSQAYRSADVATVAPFEYIILPLSVFWGWTIFGTLPNATTTLGILLIAGSGIYVFARERKKPRQE